MHTRNPDVMVSIPRSLPSSLSTSCIDTSSNFLMEKFFGKGTKYPGLSILSFLPCYKPTIMQHGMPGAVQIVSTV